nr:stage II sporulation protein M [Paenactinomyces guangxiensis]
MFEFPYLFYQRSQFFFVAGFLLFAGFLLAFLLTYFNEDYAPYFLPPEVATHVDPDQIGQQQWNHAIVSSEIMVNNIQVAFMCFAWGILFGIGTVWSLFMNGMLIGALAALYHRADGGYPFWAFIWPHGVIELTAIFIAGAAGLSLAYRFFVPGEMTRRHSLIKEGIVTIKLMLGVIPMFMIAGVIEGYITPAPWPHWTKYLVALITLLLLLLYFGWPFFKYGISQSTASKSPGREQDAHLV